MITGKVLTLEYKDADEAWALPLYKIESWNQTSREMCSLPRTNNYIPLKDGIIWLSKHDWIRPSTNIFIHIHTEYSQRTKYYRRC